MGLYNFVLYAFVYNCIILGHNTMESKKRGSRRSLDCTDCGRTARKGLDGGVCPPCRNKAKKVMEKKKLAKKVNRRKSQTPPVEIEKKEDEKDDAVETAEDEEDVTTKVMKLLKNDTKKGTEAVEKEKTAVEEVFPDAADEVGEDTVDGPVSEETVEKEPEPKKKKLPKGACSICEVVKKRGMVKGVCTACRKKAEKEKEVVEEAEEAVESQVQEEVAAEVPEKDKSTAEEEVIEEAEEVVAAEVQEEVPAEESTVEKEVVEEETVAEEEQDEVPAEEPMAVESEVTFQNQT